MKPDKITKAIYDARDEDAEAIINVCVNNISLCPYCYCMSHTINGLCGKCHCKKG